MKKMKAEIKKNVNSRSLLVAKEEDLIANLNPKILTIKNVNQVIVTKKFLNEDNPVLIIDDFLANGCALQGLIFIVQSAGATIEGIGIAVEKRVLARWTYYQKPWISA